MNCTKVKKELDVKTGSPYNKVHERTYKKERTLFVLTNDRDMHHFKKAMLRLWPLLQITHPRLFSEPLVFAMKTGNKISQTLIRANFSTKTPGTSGQTHRNPVVDCTDAQCIYCTYILKSKVFPSSYTKIYIGTSPSS